MQQPALASSAARASSIKVGFPAKFKRINRGADYAMASNSLRCVKHAAPVIDNSEPATYNIYYGIASSLAASRLEKQRGIAGANAQLQQRCATVATVSQCKKNSLSAFVNPPLTDARLPFSTSRTLVRSSSARANTTARHAAGTGSAGIKTGSQGTAAAAALKSAARVRPASAGCTTTAAKPILSDAALDRIRSTAHVHAWTNLAADAQVKSSTKLQRVWRQHQQQLQLQEEQRQRMRGQLLQFNDAQKKKGTDELRPGLQLDARYAAVVTALNKQKQQPRAVAPALSAAASACPALHGANAELQDKLLDAIMRSAAFDDDAAAAAASDAVRAHLRRHPTLNAVKVGKVAASVLEALGLKSAAAALQQMQVSQQQQLQASYSAPSTA